MVGIFWEGIDCNFQMLNWHTTTFSSKASDHIYIYCYNARKEFRMRYTRMKTVWLKLCHILVQVFHFSLPQIKKY